MPHQLLIFFQWVWVKTDNTTVRMMNGDFGGFSKGFPQVFDLQPTLGARCCTWILVRHQHWGRQLAGENSPGWQPGSDRVKGKLFPINYMILMCTHTHIHMTYVYVCMYICIYIYTYTYVCIYIYTLSVYNILIYTLYTHILVYKWMNEWMNVWMNEWNAWTNEMKWNEMKRNEMKWNEMNEWMNGWMNECHDMPCHDMTWNEMNEMKWNEWNEMEWMN